MIDSSRARAAAGIVLAVVAGAAAAVADSEPLRILRATVVGAQAPAETLRIELHRWSTDAERTPILAAASAPPPAPAPAAAAAPAAGRGGRGAARGRGGRGGEAPPDPLARLTAAIKNAPTVGFIWGAGVTGYSIKYAWRESQGDGAERIVLATDRRVGAHAPVPWTPAPAAAPAGRDAIAPSPDAEFTVIELRLDAKGAGEGKASLIAPIVVDAALKTLALGGYETVPALLKVAR